MENLPDVIRYKIYLYEHQLKYKDVLTEMLNVCKEKWRINNKCHWYVLKRTDSCF